MATRTPFVSPHVKQGVATRSLGVGLETLEKPPRGSWRPADVLAQACCAAKKPEVSSTTRPCLSQTGTGWCLTPLVFACGGQDQFAYIPRPSVRGRGAQRPMSTHKHKMQSPLTFRGLGAPRIKLRTLIPSYTGRYIYRG